MGKIVVVFIFTLGVMMALCRLFSKRTETLSRIWQVS